MTDAPILYTTNAETSRIWSAIDLVRRDIDLVRTARTERIGDSAFRAMGRSFTLTPEETVGVPTLRCSSFFEHRHGGLDHPVLSAAAPYMERRPGKAIHVDALRLLRHVGSILDQLVDPERVEAAAKAMKRLQDVGLAVAARIETAPPPVCDGRAVSDFWLDHPGPTGASEFCVRLDDDRSREHHGWTVVSEGPALAPALEGVPRTDFVWIADASNGATPVGEDAWKIEIRPVPITGTLGGDPISTIAALRLDVPRISWSDPRRRD